MVKLDIKEIGVDNMNDLISRTALINYIKAWDIGNGIMHDQDTFIDAVNSQEVVDAKPVVHAEWVKTRLAMEYQCSNCQSVVYAERDVKGNAVIAK